MFLKWENGLMRVSDTEKSGYKPAVYTEAPDAPTGYEAQYVWIELEDSFVQTWEIVEDYEDISIEDEAEAYEILIGEAE